MKPNIRFNGFSDEWVEKKLGEITEIIMGQSPHSVNYTDNPQDHILVQGNADMKNGRVVPRVWTKEVTKMVDANYLILGVRAPVGVVGKTDYPVVVGRGVAAIKGNDFLYQYLQRLQEIGYWNRMSTGSTFDSINSQDVKDAKIQLPSLPEQQKIGSLFSKYEAIIALREQKLEELNALKKGLLQKMFPKDGAKVPELRFAGFVDDWAEKKLGELAQIAGGKTPSTSDARYWDGGKDWYTPSDLTTIGRRTRGSARTVSEFASLRIWPESTILLSTRAGIGKMAILTKEASINQGLKAILLKKDFDPDFIYSYQPTISKQANRLASGSTFTEISTHDVNKIKLNVPSLPEQQKIGQLFKHLDARISNEQSKIEQLKAQKQGLLQRML